MKKPDVEVVVAKSDKAFLTEMQFYKMNAYLNEMKLADLRYQVDFANQTTRDHQIEIAKLKQEIRRTGLVALSEVAQKAKDSYAEFKKELESELGVSLDGKVVDNVTFEVKTV